MTTQVESAVDGKATGIVKWVAVVVLLVGATLGNHYLEQAQQVPAWARIGGMIVAGLLGLVLALTTTQGRGFIGLLKEAQIEARKVVWPTGEETWRTTLIVLAVVVVSSLILWALDSLFAMIISSIIG
jgi:preprotein translocase subunit SecE